jgi:oligopeptide transport system ATP-binding protein
MTELLRAESLVKHFPVRNGWRRTGAVHAVDDVSFTLDAGETLALVGESGCGKSTTGRLVLRLLEATSGKVWFEGREIFSLEESEMRKLRASLQIVFQDPYGSLNPRMTIGQMLDEPLALHGKSAGLRTERIAEILSLVGLRPDHARRYPHEFSGGQRQRIGIARALAAEPRLVVSRCPPSTCRSRRRW